MRPSSTIRPTTKGPIAAAVLSRVQPPRIVGTAGGNSAFALFSSSPKSAESEVPVARVTLARDLPTDNNDDDGSFELFGDSDCCVYASEQTIKKSRFIGLARYAADWKDASAFIEHVRTRVHPKARHWCFAYRGSIVGGSGGGGDKNDNDKNDGSGRTCTTITERASDDGEPSGTAGQPILNALSTEMPCAGGLVDVVVVVVRYSGGIKLGAGGLVRAYGGTARMVLRNHADYHITVVPRQTLTVSAVQPKFVGSVYDLAARHGATVVSTSDDYTGFSVTCESSAVREFTEGLMDATRGNVVIR